MGNNIGIEKNIVQNSVNKYTDLEKNCYKEFRKYIFIWIILVPTDLEFDKRTSLQFWFPWERL